MNYLLFNNDCLISHGHQVRRLKRDDGLETILGTVDSASICVVDVDVLIAAAVEAPLEKKDSILVRKFTGLYQHDVYIIQDERIDTNLFQVMGIKEQRIREIYALIPPSRVRLLVPYGMALRQAMFKNGIDLNKTIVLVDDQGAEQLLTVFDGLKFSRTRIIANTGEDLLPEIKRSRIDFLKKNEEFLNANKDFVIVTNNQSLAFEISRNVEKIPVEYLDLAYPALEGLKDLESPIKYRLPEEILRQRKELQWKKNLVTVSVSFCMFAAAFLYFVFNKIEGGLDREQYAMARQLNTRLNGSLETLNQETYRQDLKARKTLNYGIRYLEAVDLIPASYQVDSFNFSKSGRWCLEMSLSNSDGIYDPIPQLRILKNADIKDTFVNNQPAKHLRILL